MSLLVGPVDVQTEWTNWKSLHSRSYESKEEEQKRFEIFESKLQEIISHNKKYQAGEVTYTKALNKFADRTSEEIPKGLKAPKHL